MSSTTKHLWYKHNIVTIFRMKWLFWISMVLDICRAFGVSTICIFYTWLIYNSFIYIQYLGTYLFHLALTRFNLNVKLFTISFTVGKETTREAIYILPAIWLSILIAGEKRLSSLHLDASPSRSFTLELKL